MRSGGFPGAELAGCSQSVAPRLKISASLVMFSPSCKCLSGPSGISPFLPHWLVGWAGSGCSWEHPSVQHTERFAVGLEALGCVCWAQPLLGQLKGSEVLIARMQGPSSVPAWGLLQPRCHSRGADSVGPSRTCKPRTGSSVACSAFSGCFAGNSPFTHQLLPRSGEGAAWMEADGPLASLSAGLGYSWECVLGHILFPRLCFNSFHFSTLLLKLPGASSAGLGWISTQEWG